MTRGKHRARATITLTMILVAAVALMAGTGPAAAAGSLYVSPTGNDGDSCLAVGEACATLAEAVSKASSGDTIYVEVGTYTGTGSQVVAIDKNLTFLGGWNPAFDAQTGLSTIDGEKDRGGVWINPSKTVSFDRFEVKRSSFAWAAIENRGDLTLTRSVIRNNQGKGISSGGSASAALTIDQTTVKGNESTGIFVSDGTAEITNTTINGNSGGTGGGGISNGGDLTLRNVTLSDNHAAAGAAIKNSSFGDVLISNATIVFNEAYLWPNAAIDNNGTIRIGNSIVYGNTNDRGGGNCLGTGLISRGFNVMTGCATSGDTDKDISGDPMLGPLAANGGLTETHALLDGSPALDAGRHSTPGTFGKACEALDQRGIPRPQGNYCDIGAFESAGTCNGAMITIAGTENSETIMGTTGDDVIAARGGNDVVRGLSGDDTICGEGGRDRLRGGSGDDELLGGSKRDKLFGQGGSDTLEGDGGSDVLKGGGKSDTLLGGNGDDTLLGGAGNDSANGQAGTDTCDAEVEVACEL